MKCSRMPKVSCRPRRGGRARPGELLGDLRRRLAPGQVLVGAPGGELDAGIGRAAEIERRPRRLHRRKAEPRADRLDVLAVERRLALRQQRLEDGEEFLGMGVALVMRQEDAIAGELRRVAADHDIEQQAAVRQAVEGRGEPRVIGRRSDPGRIATRYFSRSVKGASEAAVTKDSSQAAPVGSSTPE